MRSRTPFSFGDDDATAAVFSTLAAHEIEALALLLRSKKRQAKLMRRIIAGKEPRLETLMLLRALTEPRSK